MEGFLGIGGNELLIILIFAFLIFGPDKLPQIARTIGRAIAKFRDAQNEVNEVIRTEVYDPATDRDNPLQKVAEKAADLNKAQQPAATETFAERKARYDKIRAERKAREDAARAKAAAEVAESKAASGDTPAAVTAAGVADVPVAASPNDDTAASAAAGGASASVAAEPSENAAAATPAPAAEPTDEELDILLGVAKPQPAAAAAEGGEA